MGTHPIFESDFDCLTEKMTSVIDDDVIRTRLLLDGEGAGDDRKLTLILKSFLKWCNNPEPDNAAYQKILNLLDRAEYQVKKLELIGKVNLEQREKYEETEKLIEAEMENAAETIAKATNELAEAKKYKANQQEYDALAQIILKHPDRDSSEKQIQQIDSEIQSLNKENDALNEKLLGRRRELHVLLQSIHGLEAKLKRDENVANVQADTMEID